MSLLNDAKTAKRISVMGPHARETEKEIFERKIHDIVKCKESFWVSRINKVFIEKCRNELNGEPMYLILVESSNNGKSAVDTKNTIVATKYSEDKINWKTIDANLSHVTGKLGKNGATAYYYDDIELCEKSEEYLDLNYYSEDDKKSVPIKFIIGKSNVFAQKQKVKLKGVMKNSIRKIVAVLRLKAPYVVWVKK